MKTFFSYAVASYREYRAAKKKSKAYRITLFNRDFDVASLEEKVLSTL